MTDTPSAHEAEPPSAEPAWLQAVKDAFEELHGALEHLVSFDPEDEAVSTLEAAKGVADAADKLVEAMEPAADAEEQRLSEKGRVP